jgi:hypothetical protein
VVIAGLVAAQVVLYGPSLAGRKVLLPLDLLALKGVYLPETREYADVQPFDDVLVDQVLLFESERQFVAREYRAGRLPLWNPSIYLGAPFVVWDKYSPFTLLHCLFPSPVTLAWLQLLKSLIAGVGAYVFFRRVPVVGFWPATVGAWCYPLTGFFTLWQGYPHTNVLAFLPWMLLATDGVVRRPLGWGGPFLAVQTALIFVIRADMACQVLLVTGLFGLWRLCAAYWPGWRLRCAFLAASTAVGAWALGIFLAAPYLLPLAEYTRSGDRMLRRGAGQEERRPGGLFELPRTVVPEVYGATYAGTYMQVAGNLPESAAATYSGLLGALLLAPLAWLSRPHRSLCYFATILAFLGLGWTLNVPGIITVLRWPALNLLSHNRSVFAASFALLMLAVIGLDVIGRRTLVWRWQCFIPILVVALLALWLGRRMAEMPEPFYPDQIGPTTPQEARAHHQRVHIQALILCAAALGGWAIIRFGRGTRPWFGPVLAGSIIAELLWFAYGRNPQCDPKLYYPPLPVLERLAELQPGRVIGMRCLPANSAAAAGLRDVRGYDSIDPRPLIELLDLVRDPKSRPLKYARVQWYFPAYEVSPDGRPLLPSVLDLLGVRYLIFRGTPPDSVKPLFVSPDYWALENPKAMPRVFIPETVEQAPASTEELLGLLASPDFQPARVAYTGESISCRGTCQGTATIVAEAPCEVAVKVDMKTPGLLVLADLWFDGWKAYLDGEAVPLVRTNHALRGVVVPPGCSQILFRYEPASFAAGIKVLIIGLIGLCAWSAIIGWMHWKQTRPRLPQGVLDRHYLAARG